LFVSCAVVVLGVGSLHCSSADAGTEGDDANVTGGQAFKAVCSDLWSRRCAEWKTCLPNDFNTRFTSTDDCVSQRGAACAAGFDGEAVTAKPADVKACFDGDKTLSCTQLTRLLFDPNADPNTTNADPACAKIPAGTRKDGESCAFHAECSGGACIRAGECGTCATRQAAGGACKVNEHCKPGLSCGADGKCAPISEKGGDCAVADCHTDLLCGADKTCGDRIPDGAACDPTSLSVRCNWFAGSLCDVDSKTCQPHKIGAAGDSCFMPMPGTLKVTFHNLCGPGLRCAQNAHRAGLVEK
jgi:hypothetical protein